MDIKKGIPASPGIGISQAFVLGSEELRIPERTIDPASVEVELARFHDALSRSATEIRALAANVAGMGGDIAQIFETHVAILNDPAIAGEVESLVREQHYTAEYATSRVMRRWIKLFREIQDDYFSQRYHDIHDIARRILRHLLGEKREALGALTSDVVIVAHDLTPSETAQLDRERVVGFVTEAGGSTGHTGIVARTLGIPAVVGIENITADVSGGDWVIVDGYRGVVIVDPDERALARYREKESRHRDRVAALATERALPTETQDGYEVRLCANIELASEVRLAIESGAEGIGLYRTEFIYAEYDSPTEADHLREYRSAIKQLGGRPLVIRTLDFGADKVFGNISLPSERNPFLGCRSIRLCFERQDLFRTQLRALLRVAGEAPPGAVKMLLPMISSLDEILRAKELIDEVRRELAAEGVPHRAELPTGVMIEIPSAALIADILAEEVDFFSIGTNDLIQYALAVDRTNEQVAPLFQPAHPAVLRLVANVLEIGRRSGVDVAICGEMSGDPNYALLLLGMGLREFSCSPGAVPEIKKLIRSTTVDRARTVAERALAHERADEVQAYLAEEIARILPDAV